MTRRRFDLSDNEWIIICPLLPNKSRGVPRVDDRRVINGILPLGGRAGPLWAVSYMTCYNRFVRWRKAGVWDRFWQTFPRLLMAMADRCACIFFEGQAADCTQADPLLDVLTETTWI